MSACSFGVCDKFSSDLYILVELWTVVVGRTLPVLGLTQLKKWLISSHFEFPYFVITYVFEKIPEK